jgi:hypothetical protein
MIKLLVSSSFGSQLKLPVPLINNIPGFLEMFPDVEYDCLEWYLFDFSENSSNQTK